LIINSLKSDRRRRHCKHCCAKLPVGWTNKARLVRFIETGY